MRERPRSSVTPIREPTALVSIARVVPRHALFVTAALAVMAASPPPDPAGPLHASGCAPAACALEPPAPEELDALVAESERLLARYAADDTPLGRDCRALGAAMRAGIGEVRMLPVMWRALDPEGNLAAVTGDAHVVEPTAGVGRVHIARGFDALNPARGLPSIVETARHEFAHLMGMGRSERWGLDEGARLAAACGPAADRRPGGAIAR